MAEGTSPKPLQRYGVPFMGAPMKVQAGGSTRLDIGRRLKRIYFLGMTESVGVHAWADPRDYSQRFFIGDDLGQIRLDYADGSTQIFPLILGESVWWGKAFDQYPNPFPTDANLRSALALSLHLYPAAPVEDGNYVAVIAPNSTPLRSIEIDNSPAKKGSVVISGITVESAESDDIAGATVLAPGVPSPELEKFAQQRAMRASGTNECEVQNRLNNLSRALYSNDEEYARTVPSVIPHGYSGPKVSFKGNIEAEILENSFYANVEDMLAKIGEDGTYHTSTLGAVSWGGAGFGTFRPDAGMYYNASWSRDMGRSLQELTELGYLNQAAHTGDYALREARLWEENPSLNYDGVVLPPHWGRVANHPDPKVPFENDGHGLISLFLYKLWQRLPDRDAWLRAHWADVKAAGDWIPWQFEHPEISGAANGVLYTTGESASGKDYKYKGNTVFADDICMTALAGLAKMADSIGETQSAEVWRERAAKMRTAIAARYLTSDPKYGQVWTLDSAGWPNLSTVLGPLIFLADYNGLAPEDDDPAWRPVNEAAYRRLVDTYSPFGFYGQAMGYGQGFVTQAALLLDRMRDSTTMLSWMAKEIYDPRVGSFVVPEGVQIDPTGHYWYRAGDLGNGVQEAEVVKAMRIVIGVDDTQPDRLRVLPRMPYGWNEIAVESYPLLFEHMGKTEPALMHYKLDRLAGRMNIEISSNKELGPIAIRLGPFDKRPGGTNVRINGRLPENATVQYSGDSWWVGFKASIGPTTGMIQK